MTKGFCKNPIKVLIIMIVMQLLSTSLAFAVKNGQVTQVGKYAVPVQSAKSWCSGVAISTRVVITAGHCTQKDNQVFTDIKVGYPGSNQNDSTIRINVIEVITEANFSYASNNKVPKDDIAFLILASDLPNVNITRVATEEDITNMRNKGEILLLQGYGRTNEGTDNSTYTSFPVNGYFSIDSTSVFDSTLQSISSKSVSACNGDSGAPVIYENGKDSILLGVNVGGGGAESNCRKLSTDSIYRTEVQIPSRHSNILVNSIVKSSPTIGTALKSAIDDRLKAEAELKNLQTQISSLKSDLDSTKSTLINTQTAQSSLISENASLSTTNQELKSQLQIVTAEIQTLKNEVVILTKYATTTITCTKGKMVRKLSGVNPQCPAGYKKK